jgi:uncharacterized protein (TIGR02996 family)
MAKKHDALRSRAERGDEAARLVWADALMEAGDLRGELIRLQCALERMPEHDPARLDLELREEVVRGEVEGPWCGDLGVKRGVARCSVSLRQGFVDVVRLTDVRWNHAEALARKLKKTAASATRLTLTGNVDWARVEPLATALPRLSALEVHVDHLHHSSNDPAALFAAPAARGLREFVLVHAQRDGDAFVRSLGAALEGARELRSISVSWSSRWPDTSLYPALAAMPALTSLRLRRSADVATLKHVLTAGGRRVEPLRDLELPYGVTDEHVAALLEVTADLRRLMLGDAVSAAMIVELLASDKTRAIESLALRRSDLGDLRMPAARVESSLRELHLHGYARDDLERLMSALSLPRLAALDLSTGADDPTNDAMVRLFDSSWLDALERLEIIPSGRWPFLSRVARRASSLRDVHVGFAHDVVFAELVAWPGFSGVRRFSTPWLTADEVGALTRGALDRVERLDLKLLAGASTALAGAPALPSLRALTLRLSTPSDADVEALARWDGARALRLLRIGAERRSSPALSRASAALLADASRFPDLALVDVPFTGDDREEARALLRARFGR